MAKKLNVIKKLLLTLFFIWSILITLLFSIFAYNNSIDIKNLAIAKAKTSVDKDMAYRSWVASHGGVYVPVTQRTPPNKYLSHIKERDFTVDGKQFTLMNPAYTLAQMMHDYSKLYGVKTSITSLNPLNKNNKPDSWEVYALEKVAKTKKQFYELSDVEGEEYLRLMNPMIVEESCLKCHAEQGYKIGDLRGGVSVQIPIKPLRKDASKHIFLVFSMFFLLWAVGTGFLYYIYKKLSINQKEKQRMYEQYIFGLVDIVEKRDYYTAGHSKRVAKYAKIIAQELGYDKEQQNFIYLAAMLHDIGKIAIPDSIFLKPYKLNDDEYKMIQEHVTISYDMLKNIDVFSDIAEIIRNHHEHYDGKGYPRGLSKEELDVPSQILSLCDAFDAMTTSRIYKKKKSLNQALEELSRCSGTQFNPTLVEVALKVFDNQTLLDEDNEPFQTPLDKERFEYFFKDNLTHLFNSDYLNIKLHENIEYTYVYGIILRNFNNYNRKYGWDEGDALLKYIASFLATHFTKDSHLIFRVWGDDFFILCNDTLEIKSIFASLIKDLGEKEISVEFIKLDIKKDEIKNIKDIEKKILP